MVLYKATEQGNVPMTPEEEAEVRGVWENTEKHPKPKRKTLEDRVKDLESEVELLKAK